MKKIVFIIAFAIATISINAQEDNFIIGVNAGIPIGNLESTHSIAFGLDLSYMFGITEQLQVGGTTGFIYFSGKEENNVTAESKSYLPIAASVRYNNDEDSFFVGTDLGYALGLSPSGENGGLYFKPFVGYTVSDNIQLVLAYTGIKKEQPTFGYVNLGVAFKL